MGVFNGSRKAYKNIQFALGEKPLGSIREMKHINESNRLSMLSEIYEDYEDTVDWIKQTSAGPHLGQQLEEMALDHANIGAELKSKGWI